MDKKTCRRKKNHMACNSKLETNIYKTVQTKVKLASSLSIFSCFGYENFYNEKKRYENFKKVTDPTLY